MGLQSPVQELLPLITDPTPISPTPDPTVLCRNRQSWRAGQCLPRGSPGHEGPRRNMEAEHAEHKKHAEAEGEEEHERITYPYMNKRDKEYPWGMQSLFFNPHANIKVGEDEE